MTKPLHRLVWADRARSFSARRYGGNALPSEMIALEPRVMLDGAVAMAAVNEADSQAGDGGSGGGDSHAMDPAAQNHGAEAGDGGGLAQNATDTGKANGAAPAASVVIVDASIEDAASLLTGVDPSAQIFYLEAGSDGVGQITDILSGIANVGELHIFSHGATGSVTLGSTTLDASVIESYAAQFVEWDLALADKADILLYGCNVAADDSGRAFINLFADLTRADVAASDDLTASTSLGGDWQLEVATGAIAAASPLDASSAEAYGYKLGTTLTPGDVAVIQFGTTSETWSLILLEDLASGSTFFVTDHGWNENTNSLSTAEAFGSDGTDRVVLTGNLTAGTVISSTGGANYTVTADIDSVSSSGMNLNAFGDSLIVYETDTNAYNGAATLLYAFNNANSVTPTIAADGTNLGWAATSETPGGGASPQAVSHFANGELTNVNASGADGTSFGLLGLNGEPDDTRVNFGATVSLSPTALREFIHTVGNWTSTNGDSTDFSGTTFTVASGPAAPSGLDLAAGSDTGTSSTDNITSDSTATISGTSVANATISLSSSVDGVVGSTTADGSGNWSITTSALAAGAHNLTATATSGGQTSVASSALAITIDTSAPAAPGTPDLHVGSDTGSSSTDNITNDTTPTFTGTAEANAVVTVISSVAGTLGTTTADGSGNWSFTSAALAEGTHTITATATDTAGNVGVASGGLSITIDTTAPSAPGTPNLTAAADTGSSNTDNITSDTTPTFTGSTVANSVVTITSSISGVLGTTTSNGSGNFLFTSGALAAGAHTITYSVVDSAGNTSASSSGLVVTIDTSAPAAPSTPDLAVGSDLGSSSTDNITSDNTPTWTGTSEANATIELFSGVTSLGTTTADGSGNWSFTSPALANITHSVTAKATDAAGNVGAASSALSTTIDTSAPSAPGTPDLAAGSDTGTSSTDNITNDTTPTLTGTAAANSTITVISSLDNTLGTTTADGSGNWSFTSGALSAGAHTITATAADTAGNTSAASSVLVVTIDASTAAPSTPDLAAGSDTGSSSTDNITSDNTPTWTGTAEANATVQLYSGVTSLGTTTADGSGNWSFTSPALANITHSVTARATDTAGNVSAASSALDTTIDRSAPAVPGAPDLSAGSDTGSSSTDNLTGDATPTLTGTAVANSTVTVISSLDGTLGTTTADGSGNWSFTSGTLSNGVHLLTAKASDIAGNSSAASTALSVTIDATPPAAPSAPDLAAASDTGSSSIDEITADTTPTLSGTAVANAVVSVISSLDGTLGTTTADGAGTWSFTSGALSEGLHAITATATDSFGNVSEASTALALTVDATAPGAPGTPDLTAASDTGTSSSDDITSDDTPTLTGTAPANARVVVTSSLAGVVGTATADAAGNWSITTTGLAIGVHRLTAVATDAAGNSSAASSALSVTIGAATQSGTASQSTVTPLPQTSFGARTATVPAPSGQFSANAAAGAPGGGDPAGVQNAGFGVPGPGPAANYGNGDTGFTASGDPAGSDAYGTHDGGASTLSLGEGSDTGTSGGDIVTREAAPVLTGVARPGSTVVVTSDVNGVVGTAVADAKGNWSLRVTRLADGVHQLTAAPVGADGLPDGAGSMLVATIDTVAPTPPPTPALANGGDSISARDAAVIRGSAEPGARITLFSDKDGIVGEVLADENGNWQVNAEGLSQNVHNLQAQASDAAGNSSEASPELQIEVQAEGNATLLEGEEGATTVQAASVGSEAAPSLDLTGYLQGFVAASGDSNSSAAAGFTRQLQNARA